MMGEGAGWAHHAVLFKLEYKESALLCVSIHMLKEPESCHIPNPDHFNSNHSEIENVPKTQDTSW